MMRTYDGVLPSCNLFPSTDSDDAALKTFSISPTSESSRCGKDILSASHRLSTKNRNYARRKSPSSVTGHPAVTQTITVNQELDAVEVTLSSMSLEGVGLVSFSNSIKRDRDDSFPNASINSLLDIDITPSPSPSKRHNLGLPICCGMQSDGAWVEDSSVPSSQSQVERTISKMLEEPDVSNGCSPWQSWSYFGVLDPVEEDDEGGTSNDDIKRALRNRACNLASRKMKVQTMRRNLAPFSVSSTPPRNHSEFHRSKSFSVKDHQAAIVRGAKNRESNGFAHILKSCTLPQNATVDSPEAVNSYRDDECCYDSDPEDFARRRYRSSFSGSGKENMQNPKLMSAEPTGSKLDALHEPSFGSIVEEFMNETTTLILHPSAKPGNEKSASSAPLAVNLWIERGQRLQTTIQPKLMWTQAHRAQNRAPRCMVLPELRGIELLDISRILKVGDIDRTRQPFAKPNHCFIIKTIDDEELFLEARSNLERNRYVHCLKLLVARFGAKVIVADPSLFKEFFVSVDIGPGNAPVFY